MLTTIKNQDIAETLNQRGCTDLEDEIFLTFDKLQALCAVQSQLEAGEGRVSDQTRANYAMILEENAQQLRTLLERHFG